MTPRLLRIMGVLGLLTLLVAVPLGFAAWKGADLSGPVRGRMTDSDYLDYLEHDDDPVNVTFWNSNGENDTFHLFRVSRQGWRSGYIWEYVGEYHSGDNVSTLPGLYKAAPEDAMLGLVDWSPEVFGQISGERFFVSNMGQRVDLSPILHRDRLGEWIDELGVG